MGIRLKSEAVPATVSLVKLNLMIVIKLLPLFINFEWEGE